MTGSHRSVVRVLTMSALITSIWIAAARSAQAQTRIMLLEDSTTGSPGCWRAWRWNNLPNAGFTSIDLVGTLPPHGCGIPYDGDDEGHGGIRATDIAHPNRLPAWLAATHPDVVRMHPGIHGVWNARPPDVILAGSSTLVDPLRAQNPNLQVRVAQILPRNPGNCTACGDRVLAFHAAIPSWAADGTTAQSPIAVVGAGQVLSAGTGWIAAARSAGSGTPHPSFAVSEHF